MTVSAVIDIEQIDGGDSEGCVLDSVLSTSSLGSVLDSLMSVDSELVFTHLPHVSNPVCRPAAIGWSTGDEDDWSDSPTRQPLLLYRHRFSYGRDRLELFDMGYSGAVLSVGAGGQGWGNLDDNSGQLIYERAYPISATGSIRQFNTSSVGDVQEKDMTVTSTKDVTHLPTLTDDVDLNLFPFLITALPVPFSSRNPVDTDVFIRLANFSFPIASGTITLYIDDVLRTPVQVSEFFSGLGGYDVTWTNNQEFEYDATVLVRWEFDDTDSPSNRTIIRYPFYTVPDLAPPRVLNLIPSDGAGNVSISGPIRFELTDFESLVDISTLVLYVNNVKVIHGVNGTLTTAEIPDDGGYTVEFTPLESWLYGDLIPVSIFVRDNSANANELFFSYSFTTEESLAPRLMNLNPQSCTVEVPTRTTIQADVVDGGHGLDTESIVFTVEEIERGSTITLIPIVHRDE